MIPSASLYMRIARTVLALALLGGSALGEESKHDELKAALADLTINVENVDQPDSSWAGQIMLNALAGLDRSRFDYPEECLVWGASTGPHAKSQDVLTVAFTAGVVQDRIYGDPNRALYHGWLNVIKYYRHYRADGTIEEIAEIEKLDGLEKKGELQAKAQEVQARHPALFDHLEVDVQAHNFADEFSWEGCGTICLDLPRGWSVVSKSYGERAYTFIAKPKAGGRAQMSLSLLQQRKPVGDESANLARGIEKGMAPFLSRSVEKTLAFEPLNMRKGIGLFSQLSGDGLIGKTPLEIKHRVIRIANCDLDDHCGLIAIMQMDAPDSPEAAVMMSIVTSTILKRSNPSAFLDVAIVDGRYVLDVPVSKLRLSMPQGALVETSGLAGMEMKPRYFIFVDAALHMFVSGWFEPEKDYKGIEGFWRSENQGGRLSAKDVSIGKSGRWDVIFYDIPLPHVRGDAKKEEKITSTHMRAEYAHAGTWLDLHCSITGPAPSKESRAALEAFLQDLRVEEK